MSAALPRFQSLAVLADAHLGPETAATDDFLDLLVRLPRHVEALVLLGDLFEIWVARPHLMEAHHRRVLRGLTEARRQGLCLFYVEGNRDYQIDSLDPSPFEEVGSSLALSVADHRIHLAHGDLVNAEDRAYRKWHRLSRGRSARLLTRVVPGFLGRPLLRRAERGMRSTNREMKARIPEEALRAYRAARADEGWDMVLLGHFHEHRRIPGRRCTLQVLPAWMEDRRFLRLDSRGVELVRDCR